MATDFIMPRLADVHPSNYFQHQPQSQAHAQSPSYALPPQAQGYHSQQVSPLSTSNSSPTSPRSHHRQRVRPMYMPAVLRPNENPYKRGQATKQEGDGAEDDRPVSSANSFISLPGLTAFGRLSRRANDESGKCMEGEWDWDLFPKPTAQPTRQHWKPDPEAAICEEPSCLRHFNYFTRRHHCRRCGHIFCDNHSTFNIPLDQDANYNPRGLVSRACGHCYTEFQAWRSRTNSQASSDDSSDRQGSLARGSQTVPASPVNATAIGQKNASQHPAEVAMSVPRDWHWSTF